MKICIRIVFIVKVKIVLKKVKQEQINEDIFELLKVVKKLLF